MTAASAVAFFKDARTIAVIVTGIVVALGGSVALSTAAPADENTLRIERNTARIDTLTGRVGSLEDGQNYLICLSENQLGIGSRTPIQCANDRIRAYP